jgi:hypothetical protein
MTCTTITALFLFAVLGVVALGAFRPSTKTNPPAQREESPTQAGLRSPKVA